MPAAEIVPAGIDGENRGDPQQQQAGLGGDRDHLIAASPASKNPIATS